MGMPEMVKDASTFVKEDAGTVPESSRDIMINIVPMFHTLIKTFIKSNNLVSLWI